MEATDASSRFVTMLAIPAVVLGVVVGAQAIDRPALLVVLVVPAALLAALAQQTLP